MGRLLQSQPTCSPPTPLQTPFSCHRTIGCRPLTNRGGGGGGGGGGGACVVGLCLWVGGRHTEPPSAACMHLEPPKTASVPGSQQWAAVSLVTRGSGRRRRRRATAVGDMGGRGPVPAAHVGGPPPVYRHQRPGRMAGPRCKNRTTPRDTGRRASRPSRPRPRPRRRGHRRQTPTEDGERSGQRSLGSAGSWNCIQGKIPRVLTGNERSELLSRPPLKHNICFSIINRLLLS